VQEDDTSSLSDSPQVTGSLSIWERVREHKIIQWGIAYLGGALALAQGEELVARAFAWPESVDRVVVLLLILGLPVALTIAWYHGHRGLQRITQGELAIVSVLILLGALVFTVALAPPVESAAAVAPDGAAPETPDAQAAPLNSIAVLPFANNSSDSEQDYFADGLSEVVMNQLTKIAALRVTAGTSSFAYKGRTGDIGTIGRELGVRHVLEGGVAKSGDAVRITVRLSDTESGFQRWSQTYNGGLADIFALQDEIARRVARELQVTLGIADEELRRGGTQNTAAYEHYLLATSLVRQGTTEILAGRVREELEQALALDPDFGLAQIDLANTLTLLASARLVADAELETLETERDRAIDRALVVAPDLPGTFRLLAGRHSRRGEWEEAEQAWKELWERASPNDVSANSGYGGFLYRMGYASDALPYLDRARLLDPLVSNPYVNLSFVYDALGLHERAVATFDEMNTHVANPGIFAVMPQFWRLLATGDTEGASATASAVLPPQPPTASFAARAMAGSLSALEDRDAGLAEVRRVYANPRANVPGAMANIAFLAAYWGDQDLAADAFGRALKADPATWLQFAWTPLMERVRRHERFRETVRELGLVDYWRATRWPDRCRALPEGDFECF
jgi:TolB-like protein